MLGNGLIVKGSAIEERSGTNSASRKTTHSVFYWWPLPPGARVEGGITAGLKQNRLEVKIPVAKPEPVGIETLREEATDPKTSAAA